MNKRTEYTVAKTMHWLTFLLISFNLLSGWRLNGFDLSVKEVLIDIHASIGTAIVIVMLMRWWWRHSRRLYAPKGWWRRPMLLGQWLFYPLITLQVALGLGVAAFIGYRVHAFGLVPYSSLAHDSISAQAFFLRGHALVAWVLIALVLIHTSDKLRRFYSD